MTSSSDRKVKIFETEEGNKLGTLKQGFMQKGANYKWNFPRKNYMGKTKKRVNRVQSMLSDMREQINSYMSAK